MQSTADNLHELSGATVALGCRLEAIGGDACPSAVRAKWLLQQADACQWRDPASSALALLATAVALADATAVAIELAELQQAKRGPSVAETLGRSPPQSRRSSPAPPKGASGPSRKVA